MTETDGTSRKLRELAQNLGTISGEDTVFVATRGEEDQQMLLGTFARFLGWE